MRVGIPTHRDRISPLFDVARNLLLVDVDGEVTKVKRRVCITETGVGRAERVAGLGADVLICGAITRSLETMLRSFGVQVVPNTCGSIDEVLLAYVSGQLTEQAFLMPGCRGGRRRIRGRRRQRGRRGRGRRGQRKND